ncbi:MAG: toll/interleukin-1 receptor domain-containing protein [Gemmatimonadetes bacterium]|nr:toll/interleukin-1 receptor domain-containing protein [Gemmatimonadota bacterium]
MVNRILFSYSRKDSEFASRLAKDLRAAGVRIWIDQLDIAPGTRWDDAIQQALVESESLLIILSPHSVASQNVQDEVGYALDEKRTVIPVLYQQCEIPFRLRRVQYIDFTADYDSALDRLESTLGTEVYDRSAALDRMGGSGSRRGAEPVTARTQKSNNTRIAGAAVLLLVVLAAVWGWRTFSSGTPATSDRVAEHSEESDTEEALPKADTVPVVAPEPVDIPGPPEPLIRADVDGYESPPEETQPGFVRLTSPGMTGNGSNGVYHMKATSGGITIRASGLSWRDRDVPPSHQSFPHVIRDMAGACGEGAEITISISGLPPGNFDVTTFHVDWHVAARPNEFDIMVYDALGKGRLVRDGIDIPPDVNYQGETYRVVSNGAEDVVIRLRESSQDDNCVRFNGIVIVRS